VLHHSLLWPPAAPHRLSCPFFSGPCSLQQSLPTRLFSSVGVRCGLSISVSEVLSLSLSLSLCLSLSLSVVCLVSCVLCLVSCVLCKMCIDPLGDHVLTCKQDTGSIRGHNHLMDVVSSLSRDSKIGPVYLCSRLRSEIT